MNPVNAVVWVSGLGWLLAAPSARGWRFLGWAYLALLVLLIATGGKDYYLAPYYPMLFAAGGVAIERWTQASRMAAVVRGSGCRHRCCSWASPRRPWRCLSCPWTPMCDTRGPPESRRRPSERHQMGRLPQFFADMFGWRELVEEVVRVAGTLPPADRAKAVIVTRNYGEAGAINFLGRGAGAPPAISGHNNYWLWGPGPREPRRAPHPGRPPRGARRVRLARAGRARSTCGDCMPYENNQPIWICRESEGVDRGGLEGREVVQLRFPAAAPDSAGTDVPAPHASDWSRRCARCCVTAVAPGLH